MVLGFYADPDKQQFICNLPPSSSPSHFFYPIGWCTGPNFYLTIGIILIGIRQFKGVSPLAFFSHNAVKHVLNKVNAVEICVSEVLCSGTGA